MPGERERCRPALLPQPPPPWAWPLRRCSHCHHRRPSGRRRRCCYCCCLIPVVTPRSAPVTVATAAAVTAAVAVAVAVTAALAAAAAAGLEPQPQPPAPVHPPACPSVRPPARLPGQPTAKTPCCFWFCGSPKPAAIPQELVNSAQPGMVTVVSQQTGVSSTDAISPAHLALAGPPLTTES
jgi:hypothetical protein